MQVICTYIHTSNGFSLTFNILSTFETFSGDIINSSINLLLTPMPFSYIKKEFCRLPTMMFMVTALLICINLFILI